MIKARDWRLISPDLTMPSPTAVFTGSTRKWQYRGRRRVAEGLPRCPALWKRTCVLKVVFMSSPDAQIGGTDALRSGLSHRALNQQEMRSTRP